ncbi:MAG: glutamate--cysteine ligase [Gammaproteobacteria bacterium]
MPRLTGQQIEAFFAAVADEDLLHSRYGIERETLRVDAAGALAMTPHPAALGSALTHPSITTDFSEALLEFVTGAVSQPWEVIQELCDVHRFTYDRIGDETLWPLSMPCTVMHDEAIPLARYGNSNVGRMKTAYRRGLGHRYGRAMQTIAGIHFNFSPAASFWRQLASARGDERAPGEFQSAAYFALLRNFRRYAWLVLYLFGASPAVCRSFLDGRDHALQLFDSDTLYLPNATSLRMSDLGYTSAAQARLNISLNSLDEYVAGLTRAIQTPYPPYAKIGLRNGDQWRQLSSNILQIANEFYSVVRPKRVANSGEKPTSALRDRGVEYVEIRALDVNPFDPVGVGQNQVRFMECFLLFCAVCNCEVISSAEQVDVEFNQLEVAARGRAPQLTLRCGGKPRALREWSLAIFDQLSIIATRLDRAAGGGHYVDAVSAYRDSVEDPSLTPSARVLDAMRDGRRSHADFGVELAGEHKNYFRDMEPLQPERMAALLDSVDASLARQRDIEAADAVSFEDYLRDYFASR